MKSAELVDGLWAAVREPLLLTTQESEEDEVTTEAEDGEPMHGVT
jgi:hypothetical protein